MSRSQQTIDDKILIDFSADTFMHVTKGLPIRQIHTCIITHNHYDHFYPEDILMRYGWFAPEIKDKTQLKIYIMKPGQIISDAYFRAKVRLMRHRAECKFTRLHHLSLLRRKGTK